MPSKPKTVIQNGGGKSAFPLKTLSATDGSKTRSFSSRDETYEQIQQIPTKSSKYGSPGYDMKAAEREMTLLVMVKNMQEEFETLKNEAALNQDKQALESLHTIAYESTRQLLLLCQYAPELVAKVARQEEVWPVLYSKKGTMKRAADHLLDILDVGSERNNIFDAKNVLSENTLARQWLAIIAGLINRLRQESARIAHLNLNLEDANEVTTQIITALAGGSGRNPSEDEVFEHLKGIVLHPDEMARLTALFDRQDPFSNPVTLRSFIAGALSLPELTAEKENVKAWMQVIKQLMIDVYDGLPEKCPLNTLGLSLARDQEYLYPIGTVSYQSNLRAGMFQGIEKALQSIAKGV